MTPEDVRALTVSLWRTVKRDGVERLLEWLAATDYFRAPSSTEHHLAVEGGLALHGPNVFHLLVEKVKRYGLDIPHETLVVCGLGHDLCKVNFYGVSYRNVKEGGQWVPKRVWVVKDQMPLGHGEKSLSILQDFLHLTDQEKLAIRWHMAAWDPAAHVYPAQFALQGAMEYTPLVTLLSTADFEATRLLETETGITDLARGLMSA